MISAHQEPTLRSLKAAKAAAAPTTSSSSAARGAAGVPALPAGDSRSGDNNEAIEIDEDEDDDGAQPDPDAADESDHGSEFARLLELEELEGEQGEAEALYLTREEKAALGQAREQWLSCLDDEDPAGDPASDIAANTEQHDDGRVVFYPSASSSSAASSSSTAPPAPLAAAQGVTVGNVTELGGGTDRANLKIKCYQHSRCEVFMKVRSLPPNADLLARAWLVHGFQKYKRRDETQLHKNDLRLFFPNA